METNKAIQMHKEIVIHSIKINKYISNHIKNLDNPRKIVSDIYEILKKYECKDEELLEYIKKILQKNPDTKITKPTLKKLFFKIDDNYSASISDEEYQREGEIHYIKY